MASRLVMIHGVCSGVGQSTLFHALERHLPDVGFDYLSEDGDPTADGYPSYFDRPEFADVVDRFRSHNSDPSAGIGHPTPAVLETAYQRLVASSLTSRQTILAEWSFMDLAEDLDWAEADDAALNEHSRQVAAIMNALDPVVLYLDGDVGVALDRAAAQRGRRWFVDAPAGDDKWSEFRVRLIREVQRRATRAAIAFEAGRWRLNVIDGTSQPAAEVLRHSLEALRGARIVE